VRFWSIATLLLGPFGSWASVVCERPRAHANRAVAVLTAPPRIVTPELEDNVA
jgi:hypothetical protein